MTAPKPLSRPDRVSWLRYLRLFRADILSAQPERLYRAWMAEYRTPFFRSFLVNDPNLVRLILRQRPDDFPKSDRVGEGLRPLLGRSVFLSNGADWARQRRVIDPAFAGGRLRQTFPAMLAAAEAMAARLPAGEVEIEAEASHASADVICRALFSLPVDDAVASGIFGEFRAFQRAQPILNLAAFLPLPRWMPRLHRPATLRAARRLRRVIRDLVVARQIDIGQGTAPDDLATRILTARDPVTGKGFDRKEMIDQIALFVLAGHETSAAALSWALYLLAAYPDIQDRVAAEARVFAAAPSFARLSLLRLTRDTFREAMRLYPPVPMMVRRATRPERFRGRSLRPGDQVVLSPWHLHRQSRIWSDPDRFDPGRWNRAETAAAARSAYLPFSAGPRACPGAGFAMAEGVVLLAVLVSRFRVSPVEGRIPVPQAHLTVRSRSGIWLRLTCR